MKDKKMSEAEEFTASEKRRRIFLITWMDPMDQNRRCTPCQIFTYREAVNAQLLIGYACGATVEIIKGA